MSLIIPLPPELSWNPEDTKVVAMAQVDSAIDAAVPAVKLTAKSVTNVATKKTIDCAAASIQGAAANCFTSRTAPIFDQALEAAKIDIHTKVNAACASRIDNCVESTATCTKVVAHKSVSCTVDKSYSWHVWIASWFRRT